MEPQILSNTPPKTDEEYQREIDHMAIEIRAMLNNSRRSIERSKRLGQKNTRLLEELERRILCGKN